MKKIILGLLSLSVIVLASENTFEERKEIQLEYLKEKILLIDKNINCIENSSNKSSLKVCRSDYEIDYRNLREKRELENKDKEIDLYSKKIERFKKIKSCIENSKTNKEHNECKSKF